MKKIVYKLNIKSLFLYCECMLSMKTLNQDFDMRSTSYIFNLSFVLWFFFYLSL